MISVGSALATIVLHLQEDVLIQDEPSSSPDGGGGGIVFVFIVIAIVVWSLGRLMDTDRVKSYIEQERGGKLLEKTWAPFGRGWYGDNNRVYKVRYLDSGGNEHESTVKTSVFSGVYFTDDRVTRQVKAKETVALEEENARLRDELERLKRTSVKSTTKDPRHRRSK